MQLFLQAILFRENFIGQVKELLLLSTPEPKLWYSKTVNKNVEGAKMMEFIKTCDQYPHNFFQLYQSNLPVWVVMIRT